MKKEWLIFSFLVVWQPVIPKDRLIWLAHGVKLRKIGIEIELGSGSYLDYQACKFIYPILGILTKIVYFCTRK